MLSPLVAFSAVKGPVTEEKRMLISSLVSTGVLKDMKGLQGRVGSLHWHKAKSMKLW